ncbi:MAG: DNA primase, partial [Cyclobacteriaceae bacterium]|nr:DNA primase [Cyclobacteriaceae bacterium]
VLFDGDDAGIRASLRGIDMILQQGMNVKAVVFPGGEDPDSYSRKLGALDFQQFLKENAEDFIHFKTKLLLDGRENDPVKKAETVSQIISSLSTIPDQVKRAIYMKETSNLLGLEEQVLYAELNKILIGQRKERQKEAFREQPIQLIEEIEQAQQKESFDPVVFQEKEALRILINYGFNQIENEYNLFEHYLEELNPIEFSNPVYNQILDIFKEELNKGSVVDVNYFINYPDQKIQNEVINLTSERHEISENWERYRIYVPKEKDVLTNSVYSNILRIKFHKIKKLIALNLEELKNETESVRQTELQKINIELKKAEAAFSDPLGIVVS